MSRVDGPRPHQKEAVAAISHHLELGGRAQAIMACATGKTLVGLWSKEALKARRTLVLAPTIALVDQIAREWQANSQAPFRALAVCSDDTVLRDDDEMAADVAVKVTTNADEIAEFLAADDQDLVVFSTYQSSPVVARAMRRPGTAPFDLTIADEAHHCATDRDSSFARVLSDDDIPSTRRLFMTATKRTFSNSNTSLVASMDDEAIFGREVYSLPFRKAIKRGLLADYQVLVVAVEGADGGNVELDDASRDVAMEVGLLKAMKEHNLRRVLTFHSRVSRAAAFAASLPEVSAQLGSAGAGDLSAAHVSGKMNVRTRDAIVQRLAGDFAGRVVVANVNCLGEGVDVPAIDSVCWIDPRTSVIQIIQGVGRGLRKNPGDEHNLATIIVPVEVDHTGVPRAEAISRMATVVQALAAHDQKLADLLQTSFTPQLERATSSAGESIEPLRFIAPAEMIDALKRTVRLRVLREAAVGAQWSRRYAKVLRNGEVHGGVDGIPTSSPDYGWLREQQLLCQAGRLSASKVNALELLPGWSPVGRREIKWQAGYARVAGHAYAQGSVYPLPTGRAGGIMANWLSEQRLARSKGVSDPEHDAPLEALPGFSWALQRTNKAVDAEVVARLRELHDAGASLSVAARACGVPVPTVVSMFRRNGWAREDRLDRRFWSSEDDSTFMEMVAAGVRAAVIAARVGRSVDSIHARRRKLVPEAIRRREPWTPEAEATLRRLVESGAKYGDVAVELGRTAEAVTHRARALRLKSTRRGTVVPSNAQGATPQGLIAV